MNQSRESRRRPSWRPGLPQPSEVPDPSPKSSLLILTRELYFIFVSKLFFAFSNVSLLEKYTRREASLFLKTSHNLFNYLPVDLGTSLLV